jgi:Gene product 88
VHSKTKLLTQQTTKITKSNNANQAKYLSAMMFLESDYTLCPSATKLCMATCLRFAGMMKFSNSRQALINRTKLFKTDFTAFYEQLSDEIAKFTNTATNKGKIPCIRLNGTSDIHSQELYSIMQEYPEVRFYDYTKRQDKLNDYIANNLPKNYHLTFSYSVHALFNHVNVSFIGTRKEAKELFDKCLPQNKLKYVDGDKHDLTFLHKNKILLLKPKGKLLSSLVKKGKIK